MTTPAPDEPGPSQAKRSRTLVRGVLWVCAALVILLVSLPHLITGLTPPRRGGGNGIGSPAPTTPASHAGDVTRLSSDARELREAFNRDSGQLRIVALLSPT